MTSVQKCFTCYVFITLVCVVTVALLVFSDQPWLQTTPRVVNVAVPRVLPSPGVPEIRPDRPCTLGYFRDLFHRYGYFPSHGEWRTHNGSDFYHWFDCKFTEPRFPKESFSRCLAKGNVSDIAILGDSNGRHMFWALGRMLGSCAAIRRENETNHIPDRAYLVEKAREMPWAEHVLVSNRHCIGCYGEEDTCSYTSDGQTRQINLEFMGMTDVIDDTLQLHVEPWEKSLHSTATLWAPTSQEFLFRYFFADRHPNVLLIFLPFHHSKVMTVEKVAADLEYLRRLLKLYVPQTTKVLLIPGFAEFEVGRNNNTKWHNRLFHGQTANEQISAMNRALYAVLEADLLDSHANLYSFIDMFQASSDRDSWSADGVHMQGVWYNNVMSLLMELVCNSMALDDF